ncbi:MULTISPECIES: hypothetical protein [Haloferax]|uniref:RelE toxin-related domain-containing protein n=1 Tax=Haloferax marinum TaxID=2666143 RepID=A0A6A8G3Y6_9EURY|nr:MULTISPECIES: hypothetical protein [Haloferax]KAB1196906.1 hypothetical protein Hfx1150_04965 [Haloferax sp. CBA1150]MRW95924.1 hypothetical protein [Haloferax marinum]
MKRHQNAEEELPEFSGHADLRIVQRGKEFFLPPSEIWRQGSDYWVKGRGGRTRFHGPTNSILVARGGVVTTVLNAEYEKIYSPHSITCEKCGYEYCSKEHGLTCPYCDHYKEIKKE